MGNQMINEGLGQIAGWARQINNNEPANSALVVIVWNAGAMTDATVKDYNTVAEIEADAAAAEVTNTGYARKTLSDTGGLVVTVDETNDRLDVDCPDQTWTAVAAGSAWTDILFAFDRDTAAGTDADVKPGSWHDFVVTPDGSDITAQIATAGFFRAL